MRAGVLRPETVLLADGFSLPSTLLPSFWEEVAAAVNAPPLPSLLHVTPTEISHAVHAALEICSLHCIEPGIFLGDQTAAGGWLPLDLPWISPISHRL